ncbi:MAG: LexA family transcriptional regulator [Phycisphaerales bacterium]|nr:LexA family transcriptional regulator [Phycisphaerales bacterium]
MDEGQSRSAARSFGPRLRELREERGLTLQQLALAAACTKGYLSSVENEKRGVPTDEILTRLEAALGLPEGELIRAAGWERTPAPVRREVVKLAAREAAHRERERKLASIFSKSGIDDHGRLLGALDEAYKSGELASLLGMSERSAGEGAARAPTPLVGTLARVLPFEVPLINKVVAGYPREFTDLGYPARVADEYVRCPDIDDPDAFAARVVGDSMLPEYREGDIVVFSPLREIKSGMDCFARLEPDGETTFKRVFFESEGSEEGVKFEGEASGVRVRLQPLNPAYAARVVEREQVGGLYAAVSVIKKL